MTTPVGSAPVGPTDAALSEATANDSRAPSTANVAEATRTSTPSTLQGLLSDGGASAGRKEARRGSFSASTPRSPSPIRLAPGPASLTDGAKRTQQAETVVASPATGLVRNSSTSATGNVATSTVRNDPAEWNRPIGTLDPSTFVSGSLLAMKGDPRLPGDALKTLAGNIMSGNVQLRGHPTLRGARGRVELPPGKGPNGEPVPRFLGFQMQPVDGTDKWFLSGVSVLEQDKPPVVIVNPQLLNHVNHASLTAGGRQQLEHALAANKASSTGLSDARNALPSAGYLEKHGVPFNELMPANNGPTDDQLRTMLRRLAGKGRIDVPTSTIDRASREQRIAWLKAHADRNGGRVMLDMVSFLTLRTHLTWPTGNRAFQAGSAYRGTDGKSAGGRTSAGDEQLMDELEEAERNGDISGGQHLRLANGLAQNLGFDVASRTAGAT